MNSSKDENKIKDALNEDYGDLNDFFKDLFEEKEKSYFGLQFVSIISTLVGIILLKTVKSDKKRKYIVDGLVIGVISKVVILVMVIYYFIKN